MSELHLLPTVASPTARRFRELIRIVVRRFSLAERADIECCGMTVAQAATLEALSDGELRLGSLSQSLGITPSTLTRNLSRLEKKGLVTRRQDAKDGRAQVVCLTECGREAAEEVQRQEELFAESILTKMPTPAGTCLVETLEQLVLAVREATNECCPGAFDHLMPTNDHPEES